MNTMTLTEQQAQEVHKAREKKFWTQQALADECLVSLRTVQQIEARKKKVSVGTVQTVVEKLGLAWENFDPDPNSQAPPKHDERWEELAKIGRIATYYAMYQAREAMLRPYLAGEVITNESKVRATGETTTSDPTTAGDAAASSAFGDVFEMAWRDARNPLHDGTIWIDEELGCVRKYLRNGKARWVIVTDSVDDTSRAALLTGGSSIFGCYEIGVGWVVAIVGDLCRMILYHRIGSRATVGAALKYDWHAGQRLRRKPFRFEEPPMWPSFSPRPADRKSLKGGGTICNLYTGKVGRLLNAAADKKRVEFLTALGKGAALHSSGGATGPIQVGMGFGGPAALHCAVEYEKGFRPLDGGVGLWLAAGCPPTSVTDLAGNPIPRRSKSLEAVFAKCIDGHYRPDVFEDQRQKFIVACTPELGADIAKIFTKQ